MANVVTSELIYDGETAKELYVYDAEQIKLQAKGTVGTFVLKGKLAHSTSYDNIRLIKANDFSNRTTVTDTSVYIGDVSGYSYITVEVTGFTEVYASLIK